MITCQSVMDKHNYRSGIRGDQKVSEVSFRSGPNRKMDRQLFRRGPDIGGDFKTVKQNIKNVHPTLIYTSKLTEQYLFLPF